MSVFPARLHFRRSESWRRNLLLLTIGQGLTSASFSVAFPFLPLFIGEIGVADPGEAAFWSGMANVGFNISLFISGPIWGAFADRYGHRKNILRAAAGMALLTTMTAFSMNVFQLVTIRTVTGLVSGVYAGTLALAATNAPAGRVAYSIGMVQMAAFAGSTVTPLLGGAIVGSLGYRAAFVVSGLALALEAVLTWAFITEDFRRPEDPGPVNPFKVFRDVGRMAVMPGMLAIFAVLALVQTTPGIYSTVLPGFVEQVSTGQAAAGATGIAFAILGLTAAVAALAFARVSHRVSSTKALIVTGLAGIPFFLVALAARETWQLLVALPFIGLASGVVSSASSALIAEAAAGGRQGRAFGAMQSVNSLAWGFGPLLGGMVAAQFGLRWGFMASAVVFLAMAAVALVIVRRRPAAGGRAAGAQGEGAP